MSIFSLDDWCCYWSGQHCSSKSLFSFHSFEYELPPAVWASSPIWWSTHSIWNTLTSEIRKQVEYFSLITRRGAGKGFPNRACLCHLESSLCTSSDWYRQLKSINIPHIHPIWQAVGLPVLWASQIQQGLVGGCFWSPRSAAFSSSRKGASPKFVELWNSHWTSLGDSPASAAGAGIVHAFFKMK